MLPTHDNTVEEYVPPRTRNPLEAHRRRSQRSGALVLEMQTNGIDVAGYALDELAESEHQKKWARLVGGAFLKTAQYLFDYDQDRSRRAMPEVMNHPIELPILIDEQDDKVTPDEYELWVFDALQESREQSAALTEAYARGDANSGHFADVARTFGRTGTMLAVYPLNLSNYTTHHRGQMHAYMETRSMFNESILLAGRLKQEPSLAQLANPFSALGRYIISSPFIDDDVARAYKRGLREAMKVKDELEIE